MTRNLSTEAKVTPTGLQQEIGMGPALAARIKTVTNHAALEAIVPTSGAPTFYCTGHTSAGDGGEGLWRWVAGNSDTANGGTILGSDAAGRWKRDFSGPVNVKWFGAKGDNSTNDTSAIQAAIDAAPTAASKQGSTIYIPIGIYVIDGITLDPNAPLAFCGDVSAQHNDGSYGSVMKLSASGTAITIGDTGGANYRGVRLENIAIDGGSFADSTGVKVLHRNFCHFENVILNMFDGTGTCVGFDVNGTSAYSITNTLMNCKTRKCNIGIRAVYSTALNIISGYYADGDTGILATDANSDTLCCIGVNLDSFTTAIDCSLLGSRITACRFEGNTTSIKISGTNIIAAGNSIYGTGSSTGVEITAAALNANLVGNTYSNHTTRISNSGTASSIFDLWPVSYSTSTGRVTTGELEGPVSVENDSGHVQFLLSQSAAKAYRFRARSDGWGDLFNSTDNKKIFEFSPNGFPVLPTFTVSTMPTGSAGGVVYVSDGAAGSPCLAFYDGGWKRCDTLGAISAS